MPLSDPFPEHLLDFFTLEDLSDPTKFALPENSDLPRAPVIPNCSLVYVPTDRLPGDPLLADPPFLETVWAEEFIGTDAELEQLLFLNYHRVGSHQILDNYFRPLNQPRWTTGMHGPDNSDHLRTIYLCLHNGVVLGRKQKYWHATHLYTWANRLVAYTQDHFPGEGLGPINYGRWWIAPGCYSLTVTNPSVLLEREDPRDMNLAVFADIKPVEFTLSDAKICKPFDRDITTKYGPDRMFDTRRFVRARVTFHFVDLTGKQHWSLLIRHAATNKGYLFVRIEDYPDSASSGIYHAFNNWLVASEMPKIDSMQIVEGIGFKPAEYIEPWTTPFHVLADLVTFMRFGVFGWENVPAFWPQWFDVRGREGGPRQGDEVAMQGYLLDSMHRLMGLRMTEEVPTGPVIPPPEPRTGEIKRKGGNKRLMRDMLKELNALVDEKEFQSKRRRYELQRRIAVWARRKRAEREKAWKDKEDADRYVEFFNKAEEWNRKMDKEEQEIKRRERDEYREARRMRRDKLKLFKKLPPNDPVKEELDNEYWYFNDDYLDSTDEEDHDELLGIYHLQGEPLLRATDLDAEWRERFRERLRQRTESKKPAPYIYTPYTPDPTSGPIEVPWRDSPEWEAEKNKQEKPREERRKMIEGITRRFEEDKKIPRRPGQVREKMPTTPITPVDIEKMLIRLEWDHEHKEQLRLQAIQEEQEQTKEEETETVPVVPPEGKMIKPKKSPTKPDHGLQTPPGTSPAWS